MSLSGQRNFIQTRDDIIISAMRRVRALKPSETPTSQQINDVSYTLNSMVQSWQADSIYLWAVSLETLPLIQSVSSYSLSPDIIDIDGDGFIRINNTDFSIKKITKIEYQNIPVKNTVGRPIQMYINYDMVSPILYIYYTPDTSYTLYYNKVLRLQDFASSHTNPDFPVAWSEALILNLAYRIASAYNFPLDETQLLKIDALSIKDRTLKSMKGVHSGASSMRIKIQRRRYN